MTWSSFALKLTLIYLIYYTFNIIYDLLKSRLKDRPKETEETLFFEEYDEPQLISYPVQDSNTLNPTGNEESGSKIMPPFKQNSGGVALKELYHLAKNNAIEYTKDITY